MGGDWQQIRGMNQSTNNGNKMKWKWGWNIRRLKNTGISQEDGCVWEGRFSILLCRILEILRGSLEFSWSIFPGLQEVGFPTPSWLQPSLRFSLMKKFSYKKNQHVQHHLKRRGLGLGHDEIEEHVGHMLDIEGLNPRDEDIGSGACGRWSSLKGAA